MSPPAGITQGTEGNISSYFVLRGDLESEAEARSIVDYLMSGCWNPTSRYFQMSPANPHLAIDVIDNWGAQFLRGQGSRDEALIGLGLTAGISLVRDWDEWVWGLGDIAGPYQSTVEFIGQHAAAGGPGGVLPPPSGRGPPEYLPRRRSRRW